MFGFTLCFQHFPLPQDCADAVNISRYHSQGHVTFESIDAMIRADIQSMHFQSVDRRFYGRMRTPKARIEARAKERYNREKAEFDAKMKARDEKEASTGK